MAELLKVEYVGQLAGDPSMQYTSKGTAVTNFSVAYNNKYGDNDETTWLRVTVWGKKAEAVNQWCKKGTKVYFEGALKPDPNTGGPRIWYDQNSQEPKSSYEVTAYNIVFISGLNDGGRQDKQYADLDEDTTEIRSIDEVPEIDLD